MKQFLYKMNHVFFFFVSFFLFIHRGFGFITFDDPSGVDKGPNELEGKEIDPKEAFPRKTNARMVTRTKKISWAYPHPLHLRM